MDTRKILLVASCVFVAGFSFATSTGTIQQENLETLLTEKKDSEVVPPLELSKVISLVHNYNDTETKEDSQRVSSRKNSFGGLENKIQNSGGVQKTILNNKIQYNFYFWLLPKNFTRPAGSNKKF